MKVTDVKIELLDNKTEGTKLKAFASVVIEGSIQLGGLRVYESMNGLFVSHPMILEEGNLPSYKAYHHPTSQEARVAIQKAVLEAYQKKVNRK